MLTRHNEGVSPSDPPVSLVYRLRVSLVGTEPEIWRTLALPSGFTLAEVHDAIQIAFGWRQAHPHVFTDTDGRRWLDARSAAGGGGRADEDITLGEVLTAEIGPLVYAYDEDWEHLIELESADGTSADDSGSALVDGAQAGPFEDAGGVEAHAELITAWGAKTDGRYDDARAFVAAGSGPWREPYAPDTFDLEGIRRALTDRFDADAHPRWSPALLDFVSRLDPGLRPDFVAFLGDSLDVAVTPDGVEQTAAPYRWLLEHVGKGGIPLTTNGWLTEESVAAGAEALGWGPHWTGVEDREDGAIPMMHFRQSAIRLGLLRKQKNTLVVTTVGTALVADPEALWEHVADRWIPTKRAGMDRDVALLVAVELATRKSCTQRALMETVAYGLDAVGWIDAKTQALVHPNEVAESAGGDLAFFGDLGLVPVDDGRVRATSAGRSLLRTMITTRLP